jgi:hypothetical protein
MSGYLDGYGISDARRENILKRIVLTAIVVLLVGGILYFQFRNFREERQLGSFHRLLAAKNYSEAYSLWGCSEAEPCPNYSYEKFLEDWGADSSYSDISASTVTQTRTCKEGIIQTWKFGEDDEVWLYVERADRVISFAPWPMCNPRYTPPSAPAQ